MTEVLNKEQVVSKEAPKNDQDLLKWLESNVKGHEELRKKLEENEQLKALLKGVDAGVWKGLFKKAKPEERAELAVLFDHLKLDMSQLSFEQTKEELELKNEIQAQLDSLRYQVLSESKNTYDNLENDNYGKKSDETLELSRARRADENIAVADLLLPEVDRPNKDAALLFQSLDHQQYALWVLQSLLKSKEEGQLSSHDILEKSSILRYYENDTAALRHDIGRITYLFNTHKSEIQKLEKQQQMLTFVKKIKDWNGMTRVIAHILSSEKYSNKEKFTEQELKADPEVMALYGKKRFFVNEIGRIAAVLNATSRENLQKIVDLKGKSGVDLKEAYNAKKFLEVNQEIAKTNPFLLLSDLNMTGELDRKEKGLANNHRRSEQQLYAAFLSNADTENVRKSDGSSG